MATDKELLQTTDAHVWAEAFCDRFLTAPRARRVYFGMEDEVGLMIGWFANAIETGRSAGYEQGRREGLAEASAAVT